MSGPDKITRAMIVQEYNAEWSDNDRAFRSIIKALMKKKLTTKAEWRHLSEMKQEYRSFLRARDSYRQRLLRDEINDAIDFTESYFYKVDSVLSKVLSSLNPDKAQLTL